MLKLLIIFMSYVLHGCATTAPGPLFSPETRSINGLSKIYLFREHYENGSAVILDVYFNDKKVVPLYNAGYSVIFASPGQYKIETQRESWIGGEWNIKGELKIEHDNDYYLSLSRKFLGVTSECSYGYSVFICLPSDNISRGEWVSISKSDAFNSMKDNNYAKPYMEKVTP